MHRGVSCFLTTSTRVSVWVDGLPQSVIPVAVVGAGNLLKWKCKPSSSLRKQPLPPTTGRGLTLLEGLSLWLCACCRGLRTDRPSWEPRVRSHKPTTPAGVEAAARGPAPMQRLARSFAA